MPAVLMTPARCTVYPCGPMLPKHIITVHPDTEILEQMVDMGPNGPLRCSGCGAYMNPYMQFSNDGATFTCNLCRAR